MAYKNPIPDLEDELDVSKTENESDYVQMEKVYFAFIDVLGFKKTFHDIKISNEHDTANKYRDVFNYYFALMNAAKFMGKAKVPVVMPDKPQTACISIQIDRII